MLPRYNNFITDTEPDHTHSTTNEYRDGDILGIHYYKILTGLNTDDPHGTNTV